MELTAVHNQKTWDFLLESKARTNILYGGAGSGKSWSIAQFLLLEKMYTEKNIRILVIRKTGPSLRKSCWKLMLDLLAKYELPYTAINKSELIIYANGNEMWFTSLDDVMKLKSIERINYVWGEEATEFSKKDFMQLHLRCRGENPNGHNALIFSFNPIDEMSFFKPITDNPPDGTLVQHSTYQDNVFLDEDNIKYIESLVEQDAEYDTIYRLGQWATPTNIIYTKWDVCDCDRYEDIIWGLDFGYSSHPAALVEVRITGRNEVDEITDVWERERIYETGLTNPDLIAMLGDIIENKNQLIIADCAEPKSIQEIRNAGFNIHPCKKGADSVRFGINAVRSVFTHISKDSSNLIKEKRSYKWKVDKDDNVLKEPVKFKDDLMDAERYVIQRLKGFVEAGFVASYKEEVKTEERYGVVERKESDNRTVDDMMEDDRCWRL